MIMSIKTHLCTNVIWSNDYSLMKKKQIYLFCEPKIRNSFFPIQIKILSICILNCVSGRDSGAYTG